jgi:hypothetical protein
MEMPRLPIRLASPAAIKRRSRSPKWGQTLENNLDKAVSVSIIVYIREVDYVVSLAKG